MILRHPPTLADASWSRQSTPDRGKKGTLGVSPRNKDFMKAQGIPDLIDTALAIDEIPSYDSFEPTPDDF